MPRVILAIALLLLAPAALADSTRFGVDAELARDDNVTRGVQSPDQKPDTLLSLEPFASHSKRLGDETGIVLRGGARFTHFFDFRDLSQLALSGRAAWRWQPARGFSAPWLDLIGEAQWLTHKDSELRDGHVLAAGIGTGSHVTDRIRLAAGAGIERRSGDDSGLYDLWTKRLWGSLDYRVGLRSVVYGRITRIAGDHVFSAIDPQSQGWLAAISEVTVADPALGSGFISYRIEATTLLYELGFNYPLAGNQALDASITTFKSTSDRDNREYDGAVLRLGYLYRFH